MVVVLHETSEAYEREYQQVRAALVLSGTSLHAWLEERGINRQIACNALRGRSFGKKSLKLRSMILRETLGSAAA